MGESGGPVSASSQNQISDTPFSDLFEKQCPVYLAMGMTSEEYWDGDNSLPRFYRESYKMKRQEQNQNLWLNGAYIYQAMMAIAPYVKAFSKTQPKPYMDKPIPLTSEEEKERDHESVKAEALKAAEYMISITAKASKKKGGKADG